MNALAAPVLIPDQPASREPDRSTALRLHADKEKVWLGITRGKAFRIEDTTATGILEGTMSPYEVTTLELWQRTEGGWSLVQRCPIVEGVVESIVVPGPTSGGTKFAIFEPSDVSTLDEAFRAALENEHGWMAADDIEVARLRRFFDAGAAAKADQVTPAVTRMQLDLRKAGDVASAVLDGIRAARATAAV